MHPATDELAAEVATPRPGLGPLAERLRPALWRYLRVHGADPETADDLVQEAFVVVLQRADFDASAPGGVFRFMRTTARQLWLRACRGAFTACELADADAVWNARCQDGTGDDYVEALRQCLERLPDRSRSLLAATYGDGAGRAAAGRAFGLGEDGVKSALRRLRAFLHDCIRQRLEATR